MVRPDIFLATVPMGKESVIETGLDRTVPATVKKDLMKITFAMRQQD
jgi:hypothetical protein